MYFMTTLDFHYFGQLLVADDWMAGLLSQPCILELHVRIWQLHPCRYGFDIID